MKNSSNSCKKPTALNSSASEVFSVPNSRLKEPLFFLTIDKFALSKVTEDTLNLPETRSTKENLVISELKDKIGSLSGKNKSILLIFISGKKFFFHL